MVSGPDDVAVLNVRMLTVASAFLVSGFPLAAIAYEACGVWQSYDSWGGTALFWFQN